MINIGKERFCAILNKMRDQNDLYNEVSDKLSDAVGMSVNLIPLAPIMDDLIYLLDVAMGTDFDKEAGGDDDDTYSMTMIEFFVYEADYGRKYKEGLITDERGNPIKLDSAEALYDLLAAEQEKAKQKESK